MKRRLDLALSVLVGVAVVGAVLRPRSRPGPTTGADHPPRPPGFDPTGAAATPAADLPGGGDGILAPAKNLAVALATRLRGHGTTLIAAGLAYYALLALFPTAIAAVSIYGLVADPAVLENQIGELTAALPDATGTFIVAQLESIVTSSPTGLGLATAVAIVAALWSASAGTKALIVGINIAYGTEDDRSLLVRRGIAVAVTLGVLVFGLTASAILAFLPHLTGTIGFAEETAAVLNVLRVPIVFVVVLFGLGALYKLAPARPWRATPWLNWGAGFAAVAWVAATAGLSVYVGTSDDLGETYGTLTGIIVTMLWFFITAMMILIGAELNDELEERHAYSRERPEPAPSTR